MHEIFKLFQLLLELNEYLKLSPSTSTRVGDVIDFCHFCPETVLGEKTKTKSVMLFKCKAISGQANSMCWLHKCGRTLVKYIEDVSLAQNIINLMFYFHFH